MVEEFAASRDAPNSSLMERRDSPYLFAFCTASQSALWFAFDQRQSFWLDYNYLGRSTDTIIWYPGGARLDHGTTGGFVEAEASGRQDSAGHGRGICNGRETGEGVAAGSAAVAEEEDRTEKGCTSL